MKPLVIKALDVARSQVGVREVPLGSNAGPAVERYLASTGTPKGSAWCAAFVNYCIEEAAHKLGAREPWIRTAGCDEIKSWARRNKVLFERPEVGDVFLHFSPGDDADHTGFVTSVANGYFGTVEGNTNNGGSREGIGVFSRKRPVSEAYRFVRWANLVEAGSARQGKTVLIFVNGRRFSGKLDTKKGITYALIGDEYIPVKQAWPNRTYIWEGDILKVA